MTSPEQTLDTVITIRFSRTDASVVRAAATVGGTPISSYLREIAVPAARRRLADLVNGPPAAGVPNG